MEIIYRSFDGMDFDTAEKCIEHEQKHARFKMWSEDGMTTDPSMSRIVWISTHGADAFTALCHREDVTCDGIDTGDMGAFIWSDELFQWIPIDDETIQAFKCFLNDTH